jgi:tetratricopeptide (TPR) repeat protein
MHWSHISAQDVSQPHHDDRHRRLLAWLLLAWLCLGLAGLFTLSSPAAGDQRDKRLPDLFSQLQAAKSPSEASVIESIIWAIWAETGDKDLDHLLSAGAEAMSVQDYTTALSDFDELTNRAPQFAEGWNKRATVLYLMGDLQSSLDDINRVLKLEPRHFGALSGLGLVNLSLEKDEAARDAFQRVLQIDPMNAGAKANLKAIQEEIDNKSI